MKCGRKKNRLTSILITSDTCPIGRNERPFERGDAQGLLNDLLPEFEQADVSIVNLECPLIRMESPIEKRGPNSGALAGCVNGLKAMGIDVVGLDKNISRSRPGQGFTLSWSCWPTT